jgi:hypothetical protein
MIEANFEGVGVFFLATGSDWRFILRGNGSFSAAGLPAGQTDERVALDSRSYAE